MGKVRLIYDIVVIIRWLLKASKGVILDVSSGVTGINSGETLKKQEKFIKMLLNCKSLQHGRG